MPALNNGILKGYQQYLIYVDRANVVRRLKTDFNNNINTENTAHIIDCISFIEYRASSVKFDTVCKYMVTVSLD